MEVGPYNSRRWDRPWLAEIMSWPVGGHPEFRFGSNIGILLAEIEAKPGAVLVFGQKDHRRGYTPNRSYAIAEEDGSLRMIKVEDARKFLLPKKELGP